METLLVDKVAYLDYPLQNQELVQALGLKSNLLFEDFIVEFNKWRSESEFSTTLNHICDVYSYLQQVKDNYYILPLCMLYYISYYACYENKEYHLHVNLFRNFFYYLLLPLFKKKLN